MFGIPTIQWVVHKGRMVGILTIQWVEYQPAVGFLTSGWKSNLDGLISNHVLGNPTIDLSWPWCSGEDVSFHMVVPWICVSISKSQAIWQKAKKNVFCNFWCNTQNNFQVAANRTLSKIDALHIAHFEDYVPLFSKHMRKLAIPSKIWVWDPLKVSWSEFVQHKKAVFWPLFFGKS